MLRTLEEHHDGRRVVRRKGAKTWEYLAGSQDKSFARNQGIYHFETTEDGFGGIGIAEKMPCWILNVCRLRGRKNSTLTKGQYLNAGASKM